jgi:hypothetical protein
LQVPGAPCVRDGEPLAWRTSCMAMAVDRMGSRDLHPVLVRRFLERAFDPWEAVSCGGQAIGLTIRVLEEQATCEAAEFNDNGAGNVSALVFVNDWSGRDYDARAQAITFVWHSSGDGRIFDGDIEVNQQHFTWADCATGCGDGQEDLQNALTHEAGHFLGLGHSMTDDATMSAQTRPQEVGKRDLTADDAAGLCAVYPPGSVAGRCDDSPPGGLELVCGTPPDSGCHVAAPGRGLRSTLAGLIAVLLLASAAFGVQRRRR